MKVIILEQALEELHDAIDYYEEKQNGLGLKLKEEIETHVNWILQNPEAPRERAKCYRRVNLKIFPYYISSTLRLHLQGLIVFWAKPISGRLG